MDMNMNLKNVDSDRLLSDAGSQFRKRAIQYMYILIVAAISILYITSSFVNLHPRDISEWVSITCSGIASMILGLAINNLLRAQGVSDGCRTNSVTKAQDAHRALIPHVVRDVFGCEAWCMKKNAENRRQQRAMIVASVGMRYEDCFDEDGSPLPLNLCKRPVRLRDPMLLANMAYNRTVNQKIRAYSRAVRCSPSALTAAILIGSPNGTDPYKLGRAINTYMSQEFGKGLVSKIAIAVSTSVMGGELIRSFDFVKLFLMCGQVILYLAFGCWSMMMAKAYATGEYRERLEKQTELIGMFLKDSGVSVSDPVSVSDSVSATK